MRPFASNRRNSAIITAYTSYLLCVTIVAASRKSPVELCQSTSAQSSCGMCIKQHPDCSWCADPDTEVMSRCDVHENIEKHCDKRYVEHPVGKLDLTQNYDVGSNRQDPYTGNVVRTQIQPQQVQVSLKPGESISFPLRYQHQDREGRDIYILNSETESQGISIDYESECRGIIQPGNSCPLVSYGEVITFNVTIQLRECRSSGGNVVSVGIGGVREVVALYINPICGCDCEKLENQVAVSPRCGTRGNLVCGACVCNPGSAGAQCECDIASGSISIGELMNQCRMKPTDPFCSGRGKCNCGSCECDSQQYSGIYCQCDDSACPSNGAEMCSGRGRCECGTCNCDSGWSGPACDCTTDTTECLGKTGMLCNGQGSCDCGKCNCNDGYGGPTCELCLSCESDLNGSEDYHSLLPENTDGVQPDDSVISGSESASGCGNIVLCTSVLLPAIASLLTLKLLSV